MIDEVVAALVRAARWAWTRDEVDQQSTATRVLFIVLSYGGLLVLVLLAGGVLARYGLRTAAFGLWLFGISFTAFVGSVNVAWEVLSYWYERRESRADGRVDRGPQRELAPGLHLARDTKIGFLATVLGLLVLVGAFRIALLLTSYI